MDAFREVWPQKLFFPCSSSHNSVRWFVKYKSQISRFCAVWDEHFISFGVCTYLWFISRRCQHCIVPNGRMIGDRWIQKNLEGCGLIEMLPCYIPGSAAEIHGKPQLGHRSDRYSNRVPFQYKLSALPLYQHARLCLLKRCVFFEYFVICRECLQKIKPVHCLCPRRHEVYSSRHGGRTPCLLALGTSSCKRLKWLLNHSTVNRRSYH